MSITHVSDKDFESEVIKADVPVVVDFWAPWCQPCLRIAPALEEIAGEKKGSLKVVKLNIDENNSTAGRFGIMSIPTLLIFQNGQVVEKIVGAQPKEEILKVIEKYT